MANDGNAQLARINGEMRDTLDEELEMEIDDDRLAKLLTEMAEHPQPETLDRHVYFKELLRLQGELVKLQDWVVHQKLKVVVLFEGRDSAGKGGVIKRITQRLNPRICRVAALPAPNERERTQWYFQRYVAHLPAGGEIVLFDRSWYNRAGVERVMGFCAEEQYQEFFHSVPEFERMLVRSGIILMKYWGALELHLSSVDPNPLSVHPPSGYRVAAARPQSGLSPWTNSEGDVRPGHLLGCELARCRAACRTAAPPAL
jgi:polyphosphate kinase 2 (PPK2 family)